MNGMSFPLSNQTSHRDQMAKTNYPAYYEPTPSTTSYQGGFGIKAKSPTNASTRESKPLPQPVKETNIKLNTPKNFIFKAENVNPSDALLRKKDLNVNNPYSYAAESNKPKYTPTNNVVKQYTRPGFMNAENYSSANVKSSTKFGLYIHSNVRPTGYNKYG